MNKLKPEQTFIIFCIEAYKQKNNISGKEVLNDFEKYEVFNFLEHAFEVLHTQSKNYIISEIEEYIKQRI